MTCFFFLSLCSVENLLAVDKWSLVEIDSQTGVRRPGSDRLLVGNSCLTALPARVE